MQLKGRPGVSKGWVGGLGASHAHFLGSILDLEGFPDRGVRSLHHEITGEGWRPVLPWLMCIQHLCSDISPSPKQESSNIFPDVFHRDGAVIGRISGACSSFSS